MAHIRRKFLSKIIAVAISTLLVSTQTAYATDMTSERKDISDSLDSSEMDNVTVANESNTLFVDGDTFSSISEEDSTIPSMDGTAVNEETTGDGIVTTSPKATAVNNEEDTHMGMSLEEESDSDIVIDSKSAAPRVGTVRNGIDVSHWNGGINWSAVRSAGYQFVFVKVSGSSVNDGSLYYDSNFRANLSGAAAAGLPVGAYHYSQALNTTEAANEANYICNLIAGYSITMPVVIDYEWTSSQRLVNGGSYENRTNVCATFCNVVRSRGYTPCVYANDSCCRNYINATALSSSYKLWVARYSSSFPSCNASVDYWQYSSSGSVPGIAGRVDVNYGYYGSSVNDFPLSADQNSVYIYRFFNTRSGEHLYTKDRVEAAHINGINNWKYEGVGWSAPISGGNVYRVYNPRSGEHLYTMDLNEKNVLTGQRGWNYEGIAWYSGGSVPVYRAFCPTAKTSVASHHYTRDAYEISVITSRGGGWRYEGVAWYSN